MELVFDAALVEEEFSGRRVLRLKKHQVLMRLGHPIMRQAMATLCRQLHDPKAHDAIFRWSIAALHRSGFEALLVFHYTVTAINELREPLHDEVCSPVFRIEGDRLAPVEDDFQQTVLASEFHPIKAAKRGTSGCGRSGAIGSSTAKAWKRSCDAAGDLLQGILQAQGRRHAEAGSERPRKATGTGSRRLQDRSREQELEQAGQGTASGAGRGPAQACSRRSRKRAEIGSRRSRSRWPCCGRMWSGPATC